MGDSVSANSNATSQNFSSPASRASSPSLPLAPLTLDTERPNIRPTSSSVVTNDELMRSITLNRRRMREKAQALVSALAVLSASSDDAESTQEASESDAAEQTQTSAVTQRASERVPRHPSQAASAKTRSKSVSQRRTVRRSSQLDSFESCVAPS